MVNFTSQSDSAEAVSDQIQVLFHRACIQHRACDRGPTGFRLSQHGRTLGWPLGPDDVLDLQYFLVQEQQRT